MPPDAKPAYLGADTDGGPWTYDRRVRLEYIQQAFDDQKDSVCGSIPVAFAPFTEGVSVTAKLDAECRYWVEGECRDWSDDWDYVEFWYYELRDAFRAKLKITNVYKKDLEPL